MENRIRPLSSDMIGKIAAGEVVERPAAAIKELIENSLDAGATNITVEIRDGGISYFRVTDNGCGIDERDIRMAFERHATSKISTQEELEGIETLGFRGEALASIAAVARVSCSTKTRQATAGVRLINEGGQVKTIEPAACPDGTTITVQDLFFNTPVRLHFLKRPATEGGYVGDVVLHAILSRPDVAFRFVNQGKTVYRSPGDGNLESAAFCIFGNEMLRKTTRIVDGHMNGVLVHGYVGVGESGRGNRSSEHFFINGRYIQSPLLSSAVEEGTRERVMIGHFPICILHITMAYDSVDVNVHPNKLQVRFRREAEVQHAIATLVREALTDPDVFSQSEDVHLTEEDQPETIVLKTSSVLPPEPDQTVDPAREHDPEPEAGRDAGESTKSPPLVLGNPDETENEDMPEDKPPETARQEQVPEAVPNRPVQSDTMNGPVPGRPYFADFNHQKSSFQRLDSETNPSAPPRAMPEKVEPISFIPNEEQKKIRLIGNVFKTYILLEYEDQLVMIDQHAAHERLNFDSMMKAYDQKRAGQELLVPIIEQVTPREQNVLEENRELLEQLGLVVEPFGENEVAIRSIPMILGEPQTGVFFRELLDELAGEPHTFTLEKRRTAILQTACKHAVKGGEVLSEDDMRYLVEQLIDRHVTPTCPHGRPLVVSLSHTELDRKFRRIQPA